MKHLLILAILAIIVASCNNSKKSAQPDQDTNQVQSVAEVPVFELDSLLAVADQKVDQTVKVRGYVTHTCKHSGKRCFIVGESQDASFRVEAKGEIGGFNRELVGSKLEITGVVKERRLTKEYLDQTEKDLNEQKAKEDGSAESCQAELNNISEMRAKMKELGKDYYSIYYMDGQNYEVLQQ
jgi:hypothetical protein